MTVTENADTIALDADPDTDGNQAPSYRAVDGDAVGTDTANSPGGTVTYDVVEPDDEDNFIISAEGVLSINASATTVDYEARSSYSITVVASSGAGDGLRTSRLSVTVKVIDAEDTGSVGLSQREPQVGRPVIATVNDEDGGVTITEWQWYRGGTPTGTGAARTLGVSGVAAGAAGDCSDTNPATASAPCRIKDATSASYTPVAADFDTANDTGFFLTAEATYTDNIVTDDDADDLDDPVTIVGVSEADVQESNPANAAPVFPDQDPNAAGDQSDSATRTVAENTKAKQSIGAAVGASDTDLLLYTLGGQDADSFDIGRTTGQLLTKAPLDFETKATYTVVVTATDPSGATDSIMVTINVTDVDDPATINAETAQ